MDVEGRVSAMTPFHNVNCPLVLTLPDTLHGYTSGNHSHNCYLQCYCTDWLCQSQCSSQPAWVAQIGLSSQGFITACLGDNGEETVKICQLPMRTRLDTPWPLQKIALRGTPHRLAYYADARLYTVLVSRQVVYAWIPRLSCILQAHLDSCSGSYTLYS